MTRNPASASMAVVISLPVCPSCTAPMRVGRRIPALNNQPELQNFECRRCDVIVTEAVPRLASEDAPSLAPH